jgi:hypothetical protein
VVELHVGSDHVGRQVRHDRIAHELPKSRMLVLWTADTMQAGMLRGMPLFEYENAVGMDDAPAALQKARHSPRTGVPARFLAHSRAGSGSHQPVRPMTALDADSFRSLRRVMRP